MLYEEYRYLVSAFLIFLVGFALGWWFKSPRQSLFLLKESKSIDPEIKSLLELSTTDKPLIFLPKSDRGVLVDRLIKHRITVLCSQDPEQYKLESPHLCISPLPNAQLVEQLALLQHISPILVIVDGLESLEPADENEDVFNPALDLLEELNLPVLIFHGVASEDENTSDKEN